MDVFAGIAGGLGLFSVGMWLLTDNLRSLVSHRLRTTVSRLAERRLTGFVCGAVFGIVTQSMPALTFITVGVLRTGLVTTKGAITLLMGGNFGGTLLVLVVSSDIRLAVLYVLGVTGLVATSEKALRYKAIASALFGGAMIVFGLLLLKDSTLPLAHQPWFAGTMEWVGGSLLLAFLVAALLSSIVQSSTAVYVLGIGMAVHGVISVEQCIMIAYGSCLGSGLIQYLLSVRLTGSSRQVSMHQVAYNGALSVAAAVLLYIELHFGIPLMKALVFSFDLSLSQQLALVFIFLDGFGALIMLFALGVLTRWYERLWPPTPMEEITRVKFIHDHRFGDVGTALTLADLEQRRVLGVVSAYFDTVRQGTGLELLREANRRLLSEIENFLAGLHGHHTVENTDKLSSMLTRQRLFSWLEEQTAGLCEALQELPQHDNLRGTVCEGVDAVLLQLLDAVEDGDRHDWATAKELTGDRSEMMREMRNKYYSVDPSLDGGQRGRVIRITNAVEQIFFLLSKLVHEFDASPSLPSPVPKHDHVNVVTPPAGRNGCPDKGEEGDRSPIRTHVGG